AGREGAGAGASVAAADGVCGGHPRAGCGDDRQRLAGGGLMPHAANSVDSGKFDDTRMEMIMGQLLRIGVVFASTVVAAGGFFYLQDHAGQRPDYRTFVAHPLSLRRPAELAGGIARGEADAIVELGILLLV